MHENLILMAASLIAGIVCMILHEIPKVMLYRRYIRKKPVEELMMTTYGKVNPVHFIDPIGLLFCIMFRVGFSKPSYYRMKDKELNCKLGITGLLSLMVQFLILVSVLRFGLGLDAKLSIPDNSSFLFEFSMYFLASYAIICVGMFLTNLFPLLSTDMAWLLTSQSPMKFIVLLKSDFLVKMVWILLVILGVLPGISIMIFETFMGV
jgi:hypothetical protein